MERKGKRRKSVHVARPTSLSASSSSVQNSLQFLARTLFHHGLFTIERGRAGPDDENSREEAGVSLLHLSVVGLLTRSQMQDFLKMYSNLVERCFTSCCNDFTSKALSSKEV